MKKLLLVLGLFSGINLIPKFVYDPITNQLYTSPASDEINADEYVHLILKLNQIIENIGNFNSKFTNDEEVLTPDELLGQCFYFLKQVGTPTALRLLEDLKDNGIYYPNGEYFRDFLPFEIDEDESNEVGL